MNSGFGTVSIRRWSPSTVTVMMAATVSYDPAYSASASAGRGSGISSGSTRPRYVSFAHSLMRRLKSGPFGSAFVSETTANPRAGTISNPEYWPVVDPP